jgi:hypothetical protein
MTFKVEVKDKITNKITHSATFSSQALATDWINKSKETGSWGRVAGWYHQSEIDQYQYRMQDALEQKTQNGVTLYRFDYSFEVITTNISSLIEDKRQDIEGQLMARDAAKIISRIRKINLYKKNISIAQFNLLMADANAEKVERYIWNGSWPSAKYLISQFPETFYSAEEKQMIISYIDEIFLNIQKESGGL